MKFSGEKLWIPQLRMLEIKVKSGKFSTAAQFDQKSATDWYKMGYTVLLCPLHEVFWSRV